MSAKDFLYDDEVAEIKKQHKKCQLRRYADRLKAMLLLNDGYSFEEVATILICDDDTIRNWHRIFDDEGIEGLQRDLYKGGTPKLNEDQLKALSTYVDNNVCLTSFTVCEWVEKEYGEVYSESGMTDLLHRIGFSYKKPSIVPGKPPKEAVQREFAEIIKSVIKNKDVLDQVYFMDAVHPMLNPIAGYGWIRKGEEKEIASNTGRERLGINGAYSVEEQVAIVHENEAVNAQSTIEVCEKLKAWQVFGLILIFADNAAYYKCKVMDQYLAENPRIIFIHLPPYCPNLNLIERLWKFYKKKCLCQRRYPNLEKMREASLNFFGKLKDYAKELETLMALNFQIVPPKFSETGS